MATLMTLSAAYIALNSVDRSEWCSKVELTMTVDEKDVTTFASQGWKAVTGGLKSAQLGLSFKNDIVDNMLDETMFALFGTVVTFEVRAINTSVSASNPKYTGSCLINEWKPINGSVGEVNEADYTYPSSGAVARATS